MRCCGLRGFSSNGVPFVDHLPYAAHKIVSDVCDYAGILHVATKTCQCGTYAVLTNFNVLVLVVEDVVAVICVRVDEGRGVEAGRVECGHGCGPLHIRP